MGILVRDQIGVKVDPINEDKAKEFIKDDNGIFTLGGGRSLITKLAASHWGYINKNGFLYDPNTIEGTLPTWTKPYPKPVLTYHPKTEDIQVDPVGRVIGSNYNIGVAREFIEDDLIPANKPHGYIELLSRISEPDAISKVLDGRYDTVSIAAVATGVSCSICGANVATEDTECTHKRFKRYDKKGNYDENGLLCHYKAGPLCGRHVAFVLTPSDVYAGVKEAHMEGEALSDSVMRLPIELFILSDSEEMMMSLNDNDSTNIFDQVEEPGKKSIIFDMMHVEPDIDDGIEEYVELVLGDKKLTQSDRDKLSSSTFCGPDRSFPVPDEAHARAALFMVNKSKLSSKEKSKVKDCVMSKMKSNGWGNNDSNSDNNLDNNLDNNGKEVNNMGATVKLDTLDILELTEDEIRILAENPESLTEDAKLSYGARKNLPDSAFCGPDRSFPAQDAAHVRNGLARLNQSKGKAKGPILSCLRSRAKKYGIKVATKVKDEAKEELVDAIYDIYLNDASIDDILAIDRVQEYISANYIAKSEVGSISSQESLDNLKKATDELDKIKKDMADKDVEINALNTRIIEMTKSTKESLIDRIVELKTIAIPAADGNKLRDELSTRTEESLNEALKDAKGDVANIVPAEIVKGKGIQDNRDNDKDNNQSLGEMRMRKLFPQLFSNN